MLAGGGSTIYGTFSLSRRTHADLPSDLPLLQRKDDISCAISHSQLTSLTMYSRFYCVSEANFLKVNLPTVWLTYTKDVASISSGIQMMSCNVHVRLLTQRPTKFIFRTRTNIASIRIELSPFTTKFVDIYKYHSTLSCQSTQCSNDYIQLSPKYYRMSRT